MKTTIDISDDAHGGDRFVVPEPTEIRGDERTVIFELREVELRMTAEQVITLHSTLSRYLFFDMSVDPNDPHYCGGLEHEHLRTIVKSMLAGKISDRLVPKEVVDGLRWELAQRYIQIAHWRRLQDENLRLSTQITELREELVDARRERRARTATVPKKPT
ncbi:MAG: hypothetical protein ACHREM_08960 [Polyangiales bacterium]